MSKSMPNVRRSERLKSKTALEEKVMSSLVDAERTVPISKPKHTNKANSHDFEQIEDTISKSRSRHTKTTKSHKSRQEQAKIEIEMRKKELLHKHQQEMLELELQMKLAKLNEENSTSEEESESVDSESMEEKPDIEQWVNGKCPWDRQDRHSLPSSKDSQKVVPIFNNDQIATSQLAKILTRQSMPKDLPPFGGDPVEWPNFIFQYNNTTAICGYSKEENQVRLQKCLKGHARKIVESLLILPQNVDTVIGILQNRFGRPEHIIMMLMDKIKKFPFVKDDRLDMLIEFSDEIKNLVGIIEALHEDEHLRNTILLQELLSKLPTSLKMNWIEHISNKTPNNHKLVEFSLWLDQKASVACQIMLPKVTTDFKTDNHKFKQRTHDRKDVTMTTTDSAKENKKCMCCDSELHHLSKCPKFKGMTKDERWNLVTSKGICFSCLIPFHNIRKCKRIKVCGINNCTKPHNQMLHKSEILENNEIQHVNTNESEINCHISANSNVLLKILPVIINRGEKSINTYALLDDASTVTLIDQDLADELELDGPQHALYIQWTNNQVKQQNDSRIVSCNITSPENGKNFQIRHARTMKGMSLPSQSVDMMKISNKYPYIVHKIPSMLNAKPKLLIGQDNWPLLVNRQVITGPWNGPALSKTLLGWVIHGNVSTGSKIYNHGTVCYISHGEKDDLDIIHDMVKQQWQIDNLGLEKITKTMSKEDIRAQAILDKTMKRNGDRYETGLLWKNENVILPESKMNAMNRLLSTERKMDKNFDFGRTYCDKMMDLEKKGYIKKLSEEEVRKKNEKIWYLPHFGVYNPNKPNKLRIVFDAASKSNGVSLNDCLLTGPDLYNSLYNILLNFRIKRYAFTGDIKEMFLQIGVREEDRSAQRFLWRGMDRTHPPNTYEIKVVFFGSTCGPYLAQEAKNRNAWEFINQYPEASRAIKEDHYMDDYLGNADTEFEAKKLIQEIIHVHKQGGFNICNWISNSGTILEEIDQDLLAQNPLDIKDNTEPRMERILGAWWNPQEDIFGFKTNFHKVNEQILTNQQRPTKREVLKTVMSIFDPLGFLANFIIHGKVLLQEIWKNKLDWDDIITDDLNEKWVLWLNDLNNIYNFRIPRQYFTLDRDHSIIQLHVFSDSSEKCYASVAYLRIEQKNYIQTAFVNAKTRVAPLKPVSIPRLELQAALMGARLGHSLTATLRLNLSQVIYWTDSKTVLQWVRSEAHRFKIFVAQRLAEIHELTNVAQWKYIPSRQNVADEATKRTKPLDFSDKSTWLYGPAFLKEKIENWPEEKPVISMKEKQDILEIRHDYIFVNFTKEVIIVPDPHRFSKWNRIRRATAWMLRFLGNCRGRNKITGELEVSEIQKAENLLYRKIQMDSFYEELLLLKQKKCLDKSSRLFTFSCELNEDCLIRLGGRLNNLGQNYENMKRPIILDPKHKLTKLLIHHYHEETFHQGQETVINNLRQKFWILHMRQAVKNASKSCQKCKNKRAFPNSPIMGQLPLCRLEPTVRCFIKAGIDYFGPITIAVKRSREKRYGVIFTCMVTRAIHLEIAQDLSTNSFIHVLRQFGCRRGFPEEIHSDNGGNFKSAEKELFESLQHLNQKKITEFCTMKNIKWVFNPPLAPHWGGAWERLIQSVKKIMKEMLTSRSPQEYILRTIFAEVENIINSRPLTHVSIDSDDSEALTPNHFLIGPNYSALPCTVTDESDLNLLSEWRASQKLADYFWKRWSREYLPFLVRRSKWFGDKKHRPIKKNDIVVVVDPNGPRNIWPKGRVVQIYPGKDGKIRVVDVKLASGTILRRPVTRICILDVAKKEE